MGLVVAVVLVLVSLLALLLLQPQEGSRSHPGAQRNAVPAASRQGAPTVAWVDYYGNLHLANAATGRQQVLGRARAEPTTPLVTIAGRLFWIDTSCSYVPVLKCPYSPTEGFPASVVKEFDPASRTTRTLGPGESVFTSANKKALLIVRRTMVCPASQRGPCDPYAEELVEVPITSGGRTRVFVVPPGWYVNAGSGYSNPIAVQQGILVQSTLAQVAPQARLGLWRLGAERVTRLGSDWGLIDAHTTVGGHTSLLAWLPAACSPDPRCPLLITDTRTGKSLRIHSPLPYGFDVGGAFSPDGARLAVFVKTNSGTVNPAMQLAFVDTSDGSIRLVPGVQGEIGESVGWARWLPGGTNVLAGTFSSEYRTYNHYLINAQTGAVQVVDFLPDRNLDVNFSVTVLGSEWRT